MYFLIADFASRIFNLKALAYEYQINWTNLKFFIYLYDNDKICMYAKNASKNVSFYRK